MSRGKVKGGRLFLVGVDGIKSTLCDRLARGTGIRFSHTLEKVYFEQLPALIAMLAGLQTRAAMRLQAAQAADIDDCACLDVETVAQRLRCSVDLVRERGEEWKIAKVLARDKTGRATRVVYPVALLRAYLGGSGDGGHVTSSHERRTGP